MGWISGLAVFFIIWWTVLFIVLPIGFRSQIDEDEVTLGTTHSAPAKISMGRKAIQTTVVSVAVFIVFYLVTQVFGIGPDDLPHIIPGT